ncbi:MAG: SDR family oxidoreductase, partial [Deltaproteobacteria bacterium]|nr:SDR family oxidoreductase [Deltaproteobacteria bacterium]
MDKPVAIVTGGGTGIGAACSRALAKEGFRVGINYIPVMEEPSKAVLAEIKEGFLVEADLTDPAQIDKMVGEIKEVAGRVDVL